MVKKRKRSVETLRKAIEEARKRKQANAFRKWPHQKKPYFPTEFIETFARRTLTHNFKVEVYDLHHRFFIVELPKERTITYRLLEDIIEGISNSARPPHRKDLKYKDEGGSKWRSAK